MLSIHLENIDENKIFLDIISFLQVFFILLATSKRFFEKKNLNYKSINFNLTKKIFLKIINFFFKIFFHFDKMKFSFSDNYINRILILILLKKKYGLIFLFQINQEFIIQSINGVGMLSQPLLYRDVNGISTFISFILNMFHILQRIN